MVQVAATHKAFHAVHTTLICKLQLCARTANCRATCCDTTFATVCQDPPLNSAILALKCNKADKFCASMHRLVHCRGGC